MGRQRHSDDNEIAYNQISDNGAVCSPERHRERATRSSCSRPATTRSTTTCRSTTGSSARSAAPQRRSRRQHVRQQPVRRPSPRPHVIVTRGAKDPDGPVSDDGSPTTRRTRPGPEAKRSSAAAAARRHLVADSEHPVGRGEVIYAEARSTSDATWCGTAPANRSRRCRGSLANLPSPTRFVDPRQQLPGTAAPDLGLPPRRRASRCRIEVADPRHETRLRPGRQLRRQAGTGETISLQVAGRGGVPKSASPQ